MLWQNRVTIFLFVPMQYHQDLEISNKVKELMSEQQNAYIFNYQGSPREILAILSMMDLNITMRLHAAIFFF